MSFSKSLFSAGSSHGMTSASRSLINPISNPNVYNGVGTQDLALITDSYYNTLRIIEGFYGQNMVNKTYYNIPNSYNQYVQYYMLLQSIQSKIKNKSLSLLITFAQDTLIGAINSFAIYSNNIVLQLDKTNLEKKVNDILTNKNEKVVEIANATGRLTITKTFRLAPVFNYYILIYGMPAFGVGFDPAKIGFLVNILTELGIDPYK
jgi:hypothetical protein